MRLFFLLDVCADGWVLEKVWLNNCLNLLLEHTYGELCLLHRSARDLECLFCRVFCGNMRSRYCSKSGTFWYNLLVTRDRTLKTKYCNVLRMARFHYA